MALSRSKYRRLPELYVQGTEVELKDGTLAWVQVLNPFEVDEARHDAQIARSRLVMALKEHGGAEMALVDSALWTDGLAGARAKLVERKSSDAMVEIVTAIRDDPDWAERLELMNRSDDARLEEAEKTLLAKVNADYVAEVRERIVKEEEYLSSVYDSADEDRLREDYAALYLESRGSEIATREFRVTEIWYGARACEGVRGPDDQWSHEACESHATQVFETKAEVRELPEELFSLLSDAYDALSMSLRDAKDSDRLASSSDSSRQPSEPEESTPSTPTGTPAVAPGTSPLPSLTPSPS